jgi:hydroxyacylglutathione hydrolase
MKLQKAKSKVVEVFPDIFLILGVNRSAHSYLVKGARKNLLIDSGLPNTVPHLHDCLAEIGLTPQDIDVVLLTHEHIDHAGGAPSFTSSIVAAHPLAANKLLLKDEFTLMNDAFDEKAFHFEADLIVDEGTSFNLGNYELQVLHTPGHCSGAICVYEPTHQLLFSADTIMANGIVGGVLGSGNVSDYIHSLKRLAGLRIAHLYPGHGKMSDTPETDIAQGIERLQTLLQDTKALFGTVKNSKYGFDHIMRSLRGLNVK